MFLIFSILLLVMREQWFIEHAIKIQEDYTSEASLNQIKTNHWSEGNGIGFIAMCKTSFQKLHEDHLGFRLEAAGSDLALSLFIIERSSLENCWNPLCQAPLPKTLEPHSPNPSSRIHLLVNFIMIQIERRRRVCVDAGSGRGDWTAECKNELLKMFHSETNESCCRSLSSHPPHLCCSEAIKVKTQT